MSSKLEAINVHLPELEVKVEELVLDISKDCCIEGIIGKNVYQSLQGSKKEQTKTLISHVWRSIREDEDKAEPFLQILARYKDCRTLVIKIRREQEDIEDRAKIGQAKDPSKSAMLLPAQKPRKRQVARSTSPSQCTGKSTKENSVTVANGSLCLEPGAEAHYNTKMELAQQEAKLNETLEKGKKLEEERDSMKKKCSTLEIKYHKKDQELEMVMAERDDLKCSNDILRLKMSKGEQRRYADKETVAKRINQDEENIRKLEKEKEKAKVAFETCNEKSKKLQQKVDSCDDRAKRFQATIDKLKANLEALDKRLAEQKNKQHICRFCHCQDLLVTMSSMCVGLILMLVMIVQVCIIIGLII